MIIEHWCRVVQPHERNTDATRDDPPGVWRVVNVDMAHGSTAAPVAHCPVCGENVLEEVSTHGGNS